MLAKQILMELAGVLCLLPLPTLHDMLTNILHNVYAPTTNRLGSAPNELLFAVQRSNALTLQFPQI